MPKLYYTSFDLSINDTGGKVRVEIMQLIMYNKNNIEKRRSGMVFSSTTFLFLFLPIVLIAYYNPIFKSLQFKNAILILSSIFFYAWGEPFYVLLMLASILINWALGLGVDKNRENKKGKVILALSVIVNIGMLFVFKYLSFTLENINSLFKTDIDVPNITLPIGISFFTFQAMSYVIDVYRCDGEVQKNPCNVALYVSFFPQLIAGPIVRYQTIAEQIKERHENFDDFTNGVYRFMLGFVKKVLIANNVALVADGIFDAKLDSVSSAWLGALAYSLQILFDFSGYSEMAIGLGKMFGFDFLENFDYPYLSKSVSEFWRKWHVSLGTWFRDYVYFPLGGSRVKKKSRLVFNLFVVWSLTGIWHGANWTFVVWGLMYFVIITVEKLTGFAQKLKGFGHIYTMLFVVIGWVIFRAETLSAAWEYLKAMFGLGSLPIWGDKASFYLSNYGFFLALGLLFCFPILKQIDKKIQKKKSVFAVVFGIVLLFMFAVSLTYTINGTYNPFIYFNF